MSNSENPMFWRGVWATATEYYTGNVAHESNRSWVALQDHTSDNGNRPLTGVNASTHWAAMDGA